MNDVGWFIDALSSMSGAQLLGWVAGISSFIGLLVWLIKVVIPFVRKVVHFLDDWFGEEARAGQEPRPGVMVRLQSIESQQTTQQQTLAEVRHEVFPNSGKSMRDRTDQTRRAVLRIAEHIGLDLDEIETTLTKEKE